MFFLWIPRTLLVASRQIGVRFLIHHPASGIADNDRNLFQKLLAFTKQLISHLQSKFVELSSSAFYNIITPHLSYRDPPFSPVCNLFRTQPRGVFIPYPHLNLRPIVASAFPHGHHLVQMRERKRQLSISFHCTTIREAYFSHILCGLWHVTIAKPNSPVCT